MVENRIIGHDPERVDTALVGARVEFTDSISTAMYGHGYIRERNGSGFLVDVHSPLNGEHRTHFFHAHEVILTGNPGVCRIR